MIQDMVGGRDNVSTLRGGGWSAWWSLLVAAWAREQFKQVAWDIGKLLRAIGRIQKVAPYQRPVPQDLRRRSRILVWFFPVAATGAHLAHGAITAREHGPGQPALITKQIIQCLAGFTGQGFDDLCGSTGV